MEYELEKTAESIMPPRFFCMRFSQAYIFVFAPSSQPIGMCIYYL